MSHKLLGIIPARIGSTRLPKKPLADILGQSLIQRVYESCLKSKLVSDFVIATDSKEIKQHVEDFGGIALMTSNKHESGTARMIEVSKKLFKYVGYLNIQGDNIDLKASHIDLIAEYILKNKYKDAIATPIYETHSAEDVFNPSNVKAVIDQDNYALYFSRQPIPFIRGLEQEKWPAYGFWKHLGVYGFTSSAIKKIEGLKPSYLEKAESLEQLSWLYAGLKIKCVEVKHDVISIDTPEDLEKAKEALK